MISYDRSSSRTKVLMAGAVAVGLAVAGGLWWSQRAEQGAEQAAQQSSVKASAADPAHQDQLKRAAAALTSEPKILADGRPADFEADEWANLKDAIAKAPNGANELKRVAEYLRFQRGFELWQSMHDAGNTPERRKLGDKLMEGLPARLTNAEVTMGEALMLCAAIINETEADDSMRNQKTEQCKARLEQSAPKISTEKQEAEAACLADWERRKATITGEYYNKPPAQRAAEQKQFEAELEKARVEIYGSAACADVK
jgi:hypothetical protein